MVVVRRLLALALFGALAAALAGPANAARPVGYPDVLTTPHFQVHYGGGPTPEGITHQDAADLALLAENAYSTLVTGWGYPAPLFDGDSRTDIWVQDLSLLGVLGYAEQDAAGPTSSGWFTLDVTAIKTQAVVAHEFMHLIQYATWVPADSWLLEGTAEWAGFQTSGYRPFGGVPIAVTRGAPDMSLDCVSLACGYQGDPYEVGGYSRWPFFQYLTERFGTNIVRDVFSRGAALADPTLTGVELVDSTLVQKGTTLSNVYGDFTFADIAGNFQVAGIKGKPPAAYSSLPTGSSTVALPVLRVPVNHLSTRYLRLLRGGASGGTCYAATLSLAVAIPTGIASRPSFWYSALGANPIALSVSNGTGTVTVPWDTCTGGQDGYLSLPNQNLTADAETFTVSGTLTVDTNTIASPLTPPVPTYVGPDADSADGIAPAIRVYGAQVVRVPTGSRKVRLIVFSSGPGTLRAAVGGKTLGTYSLRAGNNDIRFRVSAKTLQALRSTAATRPAKNVLTLTSLSTTGTKGKTITRKLVVSKPTRR